MEALQRNSRTLLVIHLAATLFMVGLIWTIHYVHYQLFAYVGESTYASFQAAHVERIGKLLFAPREMEYIERASFVEIYGLKLAYPISLLSLCFDFFKAHNILRLFRYQWFWCLF